MSVNKLISIRNVISNVMEDLNIEHDKLIPKFTRWATDAEKEIGTWYQYERTHTVLDIKDCVAHLPNDCVYPEVALLGDYGDDCRNLLARVCGNTNVTNAALVGSAAFLVVDVGGSDQYPVYNYVHFSIQNNKMIFDYNMCGDRVTLQYLKYKTDCDGFMEIGENHVLAIEWYIKWKYFMSKAGMNSIEYGKMNIAEKEWHRECKNARAKDSELTYPERQDIVNMYHDAYSGRGFWIPNLNTGVAAGFIWGW